MNLTCVCIFFVFVQANTKITDLVQSIRGIENANSTYSGSLAINNARYIGAVLLSKIAACFNGHPSSTVAERRSISLRVYKIVMELAPFIVDTMFEGCIILSESLKIQYPSRDHAYKWGNATWDIQNKTIVIQNPYMSTTGRKLLTDVKVVEEWIANKKDTNINETVCGPKKISCSNIETDDECEIFKKRYIECIEALKRVIDNAEKQHKEVNILGQPRFKAVQANKLLHALIMFGSMFIVFSMTLHGSAQNKIMKRGELANEEIQYLHDSMSNAEEAVAYIMKKQEDGILITEEQINAILTRT
jgi:hypothetical protein